MSTNLINYKEAFLNRRALRIRFPGMITRRSSAHGDLFEVDVGEGLLTLPISPPVRTGQPDLCLAGTKRDRMDVRRAGRKTRPHILFRGSQGLP